jgi:hypothetical protein
MICRSIAPERTAAVLFIGVRVCHGNKARAGQSKTRVFWRKGVLPMQNGLSIHDNWLVTRGYKVITMKVNRADQIRQAKQAAGAMIIVGHLATLAARPSRDKCHPAISPAGSYWYNPKGSLKSVTINQLENPKPTLFMPTASWFINNRSAGKIYDYSFPAAGM